MLLRHIYLYIPDRSFPDDVRRDFSLQTRSLCNFIERRLKAAKFHAQGFSKIAVQCVREPKEGCSIVPEASAVPTVFFDEARYRALAGNERQEFFITLLQEGLSKCGKLHALPSEALAEAIKAFREGGYKNEWLHLAKSFRKEGLKASLECILTMEAFSLYLVLESGREPPQSHKVLETLPDEIIFSPRFKEVALKEGNVVVTDKFGAVVFSAPAPAAAQ